MQIHFKQDKNNLLTNILEFGNIYQITEITERLSLKINIDFYCTIMYNMVTKLGVSTMLGE